jgi:hypothetical protein
MQKDDRIFAIVGACVGTVAALVAALIWLGAGITVDAPQRAAVVVPLHGATAPEASAVPAAVAVASESPGDSENEMVRRAVARLSAHPQFAALLVTDRLLVRFVTAVDAVAGGYSPREQVEFLRPSRPFVVRESEGGLVAAAGSYHRYDLAADVVDSIAIDDAVELYRGLQPRLEAIYEDVGWSGENFDSRLREAIDHLLEVESVSGPFDLEQRAIVYAYADDHVEQLSDAQKQLLRMGPTNSQRVLAKMHELREIMGWPPRPPDTRTDELEVVAPQTDAPLIVAGASTVMTIEPIDDLAGATETQ